MIAGAYGDFGEYFNIDPVIMRFLVASTFLLGGSGLIIYLIAWFIIPLNPAIE